MSRWSIRTGAGSTTLRGAHDGVVVLASERDSGPQLVDLHHGERAVVNGLVALIDDLDQEVRRRVSDTAAIKHSNDVAEVVRS